MAKDDRLFAPFPIEMDEHPKIIGLSDAAFRAVFEATFYSRRMMSDGFLDERVVLKRWSQEVADELSCNDPERPSWVRVELGWHIHNFERYHPVRAEIEAKRSVVAKARSEAGKRGNQARWAVSDEADESQSVATASQTDRKPIAKYRSETETETETETRSIKRESANRGSRLPADWQPSPELVASAKADAPAVDLKAEHKVFVDYWLGVPGQKGVKLTWDGTWRNWMRRKQGDMAGRNSKPTPSQRALNTLQLATDIDMKGIGA